MIKSFGIFVVSTILLLVGVFFNSSKSADELQDLGFRWEPAAEKQVIGHVSQRDIEAGNWSLMELRIAGWRLFNAQFTTKDGVGRPGATGNQEPTRRPLGTGEMFVRTAGPDSNSCASCHNRPTIGGAGDFATNVFVGLGSRHPVFKSIDQNFTAERDTPDMHGSGVIELLAREMTVDLRNIREKTKLIAANTNKTQKVQLTTKGVNFGFIIVEPNGVIDLGGIEGIDRDLVVRPWGQKGSVTSLRTFTVSAANLHHGIQADERFGLSLTGTSDFDRDGFDNELTDGDVTALVLFQASLNVPGQYVPENKFDRRQIEKGRKLFERSMCASCHLPELKLKSPVFCEPGPYNLEGTLRATDVDSPFCINLAEDIPAPKLNKDPVSGDYLVRAFTDLKRHVISDAERPHFANEVLVEGLIPTNQFITKRLWASGSTSPYGHRGDLTTISDAIKHHGGEANNSRLEFEALPYTDQKAIIDFLYSLQILPEGSNYTEIAPKSVRLPYSK